MLSIGLSGNPVFPGHIQSLIHTSGYSPDSRESLGKLTMESSSKCGVRELREPESSWSKFSLVFGSRECCWDCALGLLWSDPFTCPSWGNRALGNVQLNSSTPKEGGFLGKILTWGVNLAPCLSCAAEPLGKSRIFGWNPPVSEDFPALSCLLLRQRTPWSPQSSRAPPAPALPARSTPSRSVSHSFPGAGAHFLQHC